MNLVRSRLSVGNFLGQRCRQVSETWSHRGMCNKPQEAKAEPSPAPPTPPAPPAPASRGGFRVPGFKPSPMDKRILIWSGRFKTEDQIPELVSIEMIDGARNKIRVKVCCMMMVATVGGCILMVYLGKKAARENNSLTNQNMEKKAKWREEFLREKEAALALSEKAQ